eukprot:TRINITY_DN5056_c0_g1_i4.p1 TRINITY_DN5056_c0_g1~~TRINITY_DN5056_c0_g1_i4.p1  ORF type:complete len:351 (-),score=21.62 TRINITY_DN5056_c0_g1_i4:139-1191(-)
MKKNYELSCNSLREVEQHLNKLRLRKEGEESFEQEFNLIEAKTHDNTYFRDFISAMKNDNRNKNRYSNVLAIERTRVRLANSTDYINANYVNGEIPGSEKAYIATQGPLEETTYDFWLMVWNEGTTIIVMLTRLVENDRIKCYRYWPKEGSLNLQNHFRITNLVPVEKKKGGIITKRKFLLENLKTGESREVMHLQYKEWPDHGLPVSTTNFRQLLHMVDQILNTNAPIVVHCSAGIGRTGTFCTVHSTISKIENLYKQHAPISCNILQTVLRLREERAGMVQTKEQYIFCYLAVLEELLERYTAGDLSLPVLHNNDDDDTASLPPKPRRGSRDYMSMTQEIPMSDNDIS